MKWMNPYPKIMKQHTWSLKAEPTDGKIKGKQKQAEKSDNWKEPHIYMLN